MSEKGKPDLTGGAWIGPRTCEAIKEWNALILARMSDGYRAELPAAPRCLASGLTEQAALDALEARLQEEGR